MMSSDEFTASLDTLSVYTSAYTNLANAQFQTGGKEKYMALCHLENLISSIVETLSKHKGQVA